MLRSCRLISLDTVQRKQFEQLKDQGYNRIPVWRSVLADLDTPLSVYLKLADGSDSYLLESVEGGEMWGRYSIIGLPCQRRYEYRAAEQQHDQNQNQNQNQRQNEGLWCEFVHGQCVSEQSTDDPLSYVNQVLTGVKAAEIPELPRLCGGLVGYFGYETVAFIEPRLRAITGKPDELNVPDIRLLVSDELAVFDNLEGRLYLIVNVDPQADNGAWVIAQRRLDQLQHRLRCGSPGYAMQQRRYTASEVRHGFAEQDFKAAVQRCKDYISAGDCMQMVISQRMQLDVAMPALDIYRALRSLNPSPYMYFFDFGDSQVVGSSPEVLVRVHDQQAMLRPIAGTRPRGADAAEDQALAEELLADPKERAEHLMLIDLGRNDLGRVAKTGSVKVTDQMVIERYSHVMHIVSGVTGQLQDGLTAIDALKATFPAGTLSGAPKVRAMEIIAELEPVKRNIYAGAVGWLNWHGDADLAIAIRTGVIQNDCLHLQAGAGIVADSDPDLEWQETLSKGNALVKAISRAAEGL